MKEMKPKIESVRAPIKRHTRKDTKEPKRTKNQTEHIFLQMQLATVSVTKKAGKKWGMAGCWERTGLSYSPAKVHPV